jgi:hypothetical protein
MAIDTKPFVEFGKRFYNQFDSTHYEGCVYHHPECAILYLAGALDAAQKRLDEYAAEIERLRAEIAAHVEGNPVLRDWNSPAEDEAWKNL